jgi:hypothetical protein
MLFQIIYFEINGQKSVLMVKKEILKVSMDYIHDYIWLKAIRLKEIRQSSSNFRTLVCKMNAKCRRNASSLTLFHLFICK